MLVYRSRVFDLYCTDVASRSAPFEYVGHRGSCAALIIDTHEQVGLLAHHRPAVGHTLFELPAGTLDLKLATDEIMLREIKEETGMKVSPEQMQKLTSLYTSPGYTSEQLTLYLVRVTQAQKSQTENLRWFSFDELRELIKREEIMDMKTVAAISAYQMLWRRKDEAVA